MRPSPAGTLRRVESHGNKSYTAIGEREGSGYVALCPELDLVSQGETVESATANLKEAVECFFECADPAEVERRFHTVFVTLFEAANGSSSHSLRATSPAAMIAGTGGGSSARLRLRDF